jgi:ATP adenylyltransferase
VKRIWAPWRSAFVRKATEGKAGGCFLCEYAPAPKKDKTNLVVLRGGTCFVVMNRFPYNVGHLLIAPYRHKARLADISDDERAEMLRLAATMQEALDREFQCHGHNLGINIGKVSGAGLPGHLHLHIVPRWSGDTNFMPVVGGAKVMPVSLDEVYRALRRRVTS